MCIFVPEGNTTLMQQVCDIGIPLYSTSLLIDHMHMEHTSSQGSSSLLRARKGDGERIIRNQPAGCRRAGMRCRLLTTFVAISSISSIQSQSTWAGLDHSKGILSANNNLYEAAVTTIVNKHAVLQVQVSVNLIITGLAGPAESDAQWSVVLDEIVSSEPKDTVHMVQSIQLDWLSSTQKGVAELSFVVPASIPRTFILSLRENQRLVTRRLANVHAIKQDSRRGRPVVSVHLEGTAHSRNVVLPNKTDPTSSQGQSLVFLLITVWIFRSLVIPWIVPLLYPDTLRRDQQRDDVDNRSIYGEHTAAHYIGRRENPQYDESESVSPSERHTVERFSDHFSDDDSMMPPTVVRFKVDPSSFEHISLPRFLGPPDDDEHQPNCLLNVVDDLQLTPPPFEVPRRGRQVQNDEVRDASMPTQREYDNCASVSFLHRMEHVALSPMICETSKAASNVIFQDSQSSVRDKSSHKLSSTRTTGQSSNTAGKGVEVLPTNKALLSDSTASSLESALTDKSIAESSNSVGQCVELLLTHESIVAHSMISRKGAATDEPTDQSSILPGQRADVPPTHDVVHSTAMTRDCAPTLESTDASSKSTGPCEGVLPHESLGVNSISILKSDVVTDASCCVRDATASIDASLDEEKASTNCVTLVGHATTLAAVDKSNLACIEDAEEKGHIKGSSMDSSNTSQVRDIVPRAAREESSSETVLNVVDIDCEETIDFPARFSSRVIGNSVVSRSPGEEVVKVLGTSSERTIYDDLQSKPCKIYHQEVIAPTSILSNLISPDPLSEFKQKRTCREASTQRPAQITGSSMVHSVPSSMPCDGTAFDRNRLFKYSRPSEVTDVATRWTRIQQIQGKCVLSPDQVIASPPAYQGRAIHVPLPTSPEHDDFTDPVELCEEKWAQRLRSRTQSPSICVEKHSVVATTESNGDDFSYVSTLPPDSDTGSNLATFDSEHMSPEKSRHIRLASMKARCAKRKREYGCRSAKIKSDIEKLYTEGSTEWNVASGEVEDDNVIVVWEPTLAERSSLVPARKKRRALTSISNIMPDGMPSAMGIAKEVNAPVWEFKGIHLYSHQQGAAKTRTVGCSVDRHPSSNQRNEFPVSVNLRNSRSRFC